MTLVGIAIDRYIAITRLLGGSWKPKRLFCTVFLICVWGLAGGIASPALSTYFVNDVLIIITEPENHTIIDILPVQMCTSVKVNMKF